MGKKTEAERLAKAEAAALERGQQVVDNAKAAAARRTAETLALGQEAFDRLQESVDRQAEEEKRRREEAINNASDPNPPPPPKL